MRYLRISLSLIVLLMLVGVRYVLAVGNISIDVVTQEGSSTLIDFGSLRVMAQDGLPSPVSSVQLVKLSIINPSGIQYKVVQRLRAPIVNEKGKELGRGVVSSFAFNKGTDGTLFIQSPTPLEQIEQVIFISNAAGEADSFQIQYILNLPGGLASGRYRTDIIYTVSTLK